MDLYRGLPAAFSLKALCRSQQYGCARRIGLVRGSAWRRRGDLASRMHPQWVGPPAGFITAAVGTYLVIAAYGVHVAPTP